MENDYLVAAAQFDTVLCDKKQNIARMAALARMAKAKHPALALLAFPELALTGYECFSSLGELAEPVDGPSIRQMGALAEELSLTLAFGFALKEAGRIYNAAAVLSDGGALCGIYRKVHLFDEERAFFTPGEALHPIDTPLGRIGVMICWDLAFPEAARAYALRGADLLLSLSAWEHPYHENYLLSTRMRAYENCLPHIAANRAGVEEKNRFIGHSAVYAAGGAPLSLLEGESEGIAVGLISPAEDARRRAAEYPFLRCRRREAYANETI